MKRKRNRMASEIAYLRGISPGGNILANASARAIRVVLRSLRKKEFCINGEAIMKE